MFSTKRNALMAVAAIFSALLAPAALAGESPGQVETVFVAEDGIPAVQSELLEPRWLPWLGCWELFADAVDYREVESTGRRVVCVAPRPDGLGVSLTTHVNRLVIAENTVIADAQQRPLVEPGCTGTQSNAWSSNGRRLHSSVESSCEGGARRSLTGLSMLVSGTGWLELQAMSLDGGTHRELVVRRYKRLGDSEMQELGYAPLDPAVAARAATARAAAAGPLNIDDVIELNGEVPVEVVEAAILESNSMFALDSDTLFRLVDAGLEERVIDLMVAVSFPDQFMVDATPPSGSPSGGGMVGPYPFFYGNCYGPYFGPAYGPYGYGCDPWYAPWGYGGFYRPGYPGYRPGYGGGNISIKVPPSGSLYGGRVVNENGYARVRPRPEPHLRNNGNGVGNAVRNAFRRDGGSGGSGGSKISSSGGSSVSSSGFRSGGSSSSSSSGGKARVKAKPRGGGGGS